MNDDELEEQGFLKKILATKKSTDKVVPVSNSDEDQKAKDTADIDALMKRIGIQNFPVTSQGSPQPAPPGEAGAGPEIPESKKPSLSPAPSTHPTPTIRFTYN